MLRRSCVCGRQACWAWLLVKRFDMTAPGGRNHIVSMRSLLGRDDNTAGSYEEIAVKILMISHHPSEDLICLFRQMLLNCSVGNIDDHLKNFSMAWSKSAVWRLSPAYDITPALMANPIGRGNYHSIGFFNMKKVI